MKHPIQTPTPAGLSRRDSIKLVLFGGATCVAGGKLVSLPVLAQSTPATQRENGLVVIDTRDFPALQNAFGSVRLGTSPVVNNFPRGIFHPILINRDGAGAYHAFSAECTHAGCVVSPVNANTRLSTCNCHGSRFTPTGTVAQGPANFPLRRFDLRLVGASRIEVEVPDFAFPIEIKRPDPANLGRVEVEFLSFANMAYQVRHRVDYNAPGVITPFATSPAGPIDKLEVAGKDDYQKIYLDITAGSGFFEVFIKTSAV